MDIHMGQLLRNFRGHDGSDKFLQRFSLGIREEIDSRTLFNDFPCSMTATRSQISLMTSI